MCSSDLPIATPVVIAGAGPRVRGGYSDATASGTVAVGDVGASGGLSGASGLVVGTQITSLVVKSVSGSGSRPYAATVLLRPGQVPSGSHITNSTGTQKAAIGATYPDGSAAWAVLPGTASADGTVAVHVATGTAPSNLTAAAVAAAGLTSVAVAFGSPYGTAQIADFSTPERIWWATPTYICARYRVAAPTPGSTALEAVIDVHAWAGRALVEVTVENCKMTTATPTAPAAATYTGATVSVNGSTVATVNASGAYEGEHSKFRAWYARGWVGGDPGLRVTQSHTDLQAHPLFWKMAAASSYDMAAYASLSYSPWTPGSHSTSMGATGDHPDIGPIPMWAARAIQSGDYRAWNAVEVNDLAALTFDINYRDSTTGLPPTLTELAGKSMQTNWPNLYAGSHPAGGTGWKDSHHPAVGLMGFLSRPSPVFIELAQKVAVWNGTFSRNDNGAAERATGIFVSAYQTRGKAWGMRSLAHATFLTPDSLPWKAAGKASITANLAYFDEWRTDSKQTNLAIMWELRTDLPYNRNTWVSRVNYKLWQHHYLIAEVAKIASARLVDSANQSAADTTADWLLLHPVRWVNDQAATGSWRYMPEAFILGNASQTAPDMTNAADYATQRATWVTGTPASVTGQWQRNASDMPTDYTSWLDDPLADVSRATYFWPTLVAAVDRGVTGAATAYNTVINGITNFTTWLTGFGTEARYAATPKNPPPPAGFATGGGTGTYNSITKVWTPAKAGDGRVYAESWAIVPTGEWVNVAGSNLDGLTASITAPGWDAGTLSWANVLNAWNGFAIDEANSRVWLVNAGGHADSSNNGIYRFDFFKMSWAVQRQPSDRTAWSTQYKTLAPPQSGTYTTCYESATASPQASTSEEAATAGTRKFYFDQLFWTREPTSRHVYSTPVYIEATNQLMHGCRSIWVYDIDTDTYSENRRWDRAVDGAEIQGVYDEATGKYLFAGMGDGLRVSSAYAPGTSTFSNAGWCPWIGTAADGDGWEGVADCRYGREITVWSPPFSDRTKTHYMVFDLDTMSASVSATKPQYAGGLSAASFKSTSSGADGMGMVYVPPLNEYWILYNLAAGMTWLKLDPTTSPWTLSPKTFTGTLPTTRDKPCRKIVWLPDLNAVAFCTHESAGFYIYRF